MSTHEIPLIAADMSKSIPEYFPEIATSRFFNPKKNNKNASSNNNANSMSLKLNATIMFFYNLKFNY